MQPGTWAFANQVIFSYTLNISHYLLNSKHNFLPKASLQNLVVNVEAYTFGLHFHFTSILCFVNSLCPFFSPLNLFLVTLASILHPPVLMPGPGRLVPQVLFQRPSVSVPRASVREAWPTRQTLISEEVGDKALSHISDSSSFLTGNANCWCGAQLISSLLTGHVCFCNRCLLCHRTRQGPKWDSTNIGFLLLLLFNASRSILCPARYSGILNLAVDIYSWTVFWPSSAIGWHHKAKCRDNRVSASHLVL